MLIEIIEPSFVFTDDRGTLVQLVRDGYKQFNIITSKENVLRGNHYHKLNKEAFYIIDGEFELHVEKEGVSEDYTFRSGDMFAIPPYVMHSFNFTKSTVLASMYDLGVELADGSKDIYNE